MRTLLIEDDSASRLLVTRLLEHRGHEVVACADGETGWEACQTNEFDLVVLDWMLPGIDGLEVCRRLRALPEGQHSFVLVITARDANGDLQTVLAAGVDDYLTKPIDTSQFNICLDVAERQIRTIAERTAAEEAMRDSIERLHLAAQGTNDGFWDAKATQSDPLSPANFCWWSARLMELLGYDDHELPNVLGSWLERLHPEDRDRTLSALSEHLSQRAPYDVVYRLRTKGGSYRWFSARGQAQWDSSGKPVRMAGSIRDITEQRKLDEALRESEAQHRLIAENVTDILWSAKFTPLEAGSSMDCENAPDDALRSWKFTYASPAVERLLGYTSDEFLKLSLADLLTQNSYGRACEAMTEELSADEADRNPWRQRTLELEHLSKSGDARWYEVTNTFLRDETGVPTGIIGVSRDISARKHAEDALRESEEKWRSLVENSPDVILTVTSDGIMNFLNRTVAGLTIEEVLGTSAYSYLLPEYQDQLRQAIERAFERSESSTLEAAGQGPYGSVAWYVSRIGPVKVEGKVTGAVIIATDITHRRKMELELRKEQRLLRQMLDVHERERQLVAYEIHDGLVQHMTASLMHLEAFCESNQQTTGQSRPDFEQGFRLLRTAVSEGRRLISGLRPPILDESGVVAALEYLVNETRQHVPQIEFLHQTQFGRLAPPLESAIFRIVQEALTNVRRHSQAQRARVELVEENNSLRIGVRDWGRGFDPERVQEETFGLQGIRERARLLDGNAQILSSVGAGTEIKVEFPLIPRAPEGP